MGTQFLSDISRSLIAKAIEMMLFTGDNSKQRVRRLRVIVAGFSFAVFLLGLGPVSSARAQNVRITDYDVPISRAQRLDLSGNMRMGGDKNGNTRMFRLNCRWENYYNSLPFAWSINAAGDAQASKYSRRLTRNYRYYALQSSFHRYFREQGRAFGGAQLQASWGNDYEHVDLWVGASAGLGRYVEATALAKALRIEEFLLKEKILTDHLAKETMLQLASIIDRAKEYKSRYGPTYVVRWYADMDSVLVSSGLVPTGTVGAVGNMRMREVVEREPVRSRAHGWKVEVGEGTYVSQADKAGFAGTWPFLSGTFTRPIGLATQFTAQGRIAGPLDHELNERFAITGGLSFSYELSNLIDFLLTESYTNTHDNSTNWPYDREIARQNNLTFAFVFYLENKFNFQSQINLVHINNKLYHSAGIGEPPVRDNRRDLDFRASLGYRVF